MNADYIGQTFYSAWMDETGLDTWLGWDVKDAAWHLENLRADKKGGAFDSVTQYAIPDFDSMTAYELYEIMRVMIISTTINGYSMTSRALKELVRLSDSPIDTLAQYTSGGESRKQPGKAARWILVPLDDVDKDEYYDEILAPDDVDEDDWATRWDDETAEILNDNLRYWAGVE